MMNKLSEKDIFHANEDWTEFKVLVDCEGKILAEDYGANEEKLEKSFIGITIRFDAGHDSQMAPNQKESAARALKEMYKTLLNKIESTFPIGAVVYSRMRHICGMVLGRTADGLRLKTIKGVDPEKGDLIYEEIVVPFDEKLTQKAEFFEDEGLCIAHTLYTRDTGILKYVNNQRLLTNLTYNPKLCGACAQIAVDRINDEKMLAEIGIKAERLESWIADAIRKVKSPRLLADISIHAKAYLAANFAFLQLRMQKDVTIDIYLDIALHSPFVNIRESAQKLIGGITEAILSWQKDDEDEDVGMVLVKSSENDDQKLAYIAFEFKNINVRLAAIEKLTDRETLIKLKKDENFIVSSAADKRLKKLADIEERRMKER